MQDTAASTITTDASHDVPATRPDVVTCPNQGCEDGTIWVGVLGANDPDERPEPCPTCHGTGDVDTRTCRICGRIADADLAEHLPADDLCECSDDDVLAFLAAEVGA